MSSPANLVESIMTNNPDLSSYGIRDTAEIVYNPSYEILFAEETADHLQGYEVGFHTESGAISVDTGDFTGRSPKDKYLVRDDTTRDKICGRTRARTITNRSTTIPGIRYAS